MIRCREFEAKDFGTIGAFVGNRYCVRCTFNVTEVVLALLDGKFTGNPDGVTKDEVSIKKINNRKIKSVMEAMLKAASTLFLV